MTLPIILNPKMFRVLDSDFINKTLAVIPKTGVRQVEYYF